MQNLNQQNYLTDECHEITTGLDGATYSRQPAWHNLGVTVDHDQTVEEAIRNAGLDYEVFKEAAFIPGTDTPIPGFWHTVRGDLDPTDVRRYLGQVGDAYEVVQLADLGKIAEMICGETGAKVDACFSMRGGRRVCMSVQRPEAVKVCGDWMRRYWIFYNDHTGALSASILPTDVRVVCANTFRMSGADGGAGYRLRHTTNVRDTLADLHEAIKRTLEGDEEVERKLVSLSERAVERRFVKAYTEALFPSGSVKTDVSTRCQNTRDVFMGLFNGGMAGYKENPLVQGTMYGLLQAATEYADHHRTVRVSTGREDRQEARADSVLFGTGQTFKQQAFRLLEKADDLMAECVVTN